jgi:hypothetical protein
MGTLHSLEAARYKRAVQTESSAKARELAQLVNQCLTAYLKSASEVAYAKNALAAYDQKPWWYRFCTRTEKSILLTVLENRTWICTHHYNELRRARGYLRELREKADWLANHPCMTKLITPE